MPFHRTIAVAAAILFLCTIFNIDRAKLDSVYSQAESKYLDLSLRPAEKSGVGGSVQTPVGTMIPKLTPDTRGFFEWSSTDVDNEQGEGWDWTYFDVTSFGGTPIVNNGRGKTSSHPSPWVSQIGISKYDPTAIVLNHVCYRHNDIIVFNNPDGANLMKEEMGQFQDPLER